MNHLLVLERDMANPLELGRLIAKLLRIPFADVTRMLRNSRGILDLGVDREGSRRIRDALEARGVHARVVADADLRPLPRPLALLDADPVPAGLAIQRVRGGSADLVPWALVDLLVVGLVTFRTEPPRLPRSSGEDLPDQSTGALLLEAILGAPGLPDRFTGWKPPRREPPPREEIVHVLDLLVREPEARYRVVASDFVYDYLGDRMGLSSAANFRTLVTDVAGHAPDALLPESTLAYLEGSKPAAFKFRSSAEFEAYVRWLSVWRKVWE